jgi:hypothetical protein
MMAAYPPRKVFTPLLISYSRGVRLALASLSSEAASLRYAAYDGRESDSGQVCGHVAGSPDGSGAAEQLVVPDSVRKSLVEIHQ